MSIEKRFVIVNDCDSPSLSNVAEFVPGIGYCYMTRHTSPQLKDFDGMEPRKPTDLRDFGFDVEVGTAEVVFTRVRPSVATYEDGKPRSWQDSRSFDGFSLPIVTNVKRKGSAIPKRGYK